MKKKYDLRLLIYIASETNAPPHMGCGGGPCAFYGSIINEITRKRKVKGVDEDYFSR